MRQRPAGFRSPQEEVGADGPPPRPEPHVPGRNDDGAQGAVPRETLHAQQR